MREPILARIGNFEGLRILPEKDDILTLINHYLFHVVDIACDHHVVVQRGGPVVVFCDAIVRRPDKIYLICFVA